jgi:hypothetical protein
MKNGKEYDIEKRLQSVKLTPVPPGLREKVLGAALERKEATAWTTPLLRKCLVGCGLVLTIVFIADAGAGRTQNARVQAILDGTRFTQSDPLKQWNAELEELRDAVGPGEITREKRFRAQQKQVLTRDSNARLRARLSWEDPDEIEITKNHN